MSNVVEVKGLTAGELAQSVVNGEELFILDVRNEADYADWKIEGSGVTSDNIPYFELLEGVDAAVERISAGGKVVVVCAKEGSSIFVAESLAEAGVKDVQYLEGGMKAWSEHLEPVKVGELSGGGALYQFVRLGKGCLSYMVISGGEAAVIDAMRMTDVYESFAERHGAVIKHTMDTHLHADHISGGRKLAEAVGASYWLPPKDAGEVTFDYEKLEDGEVITVGDTSIAIGALYSPGHTIGSTSFVIEDRYLLTGDILFVASIGRPDLAGQAEDWAGDLRHTLYRRYKELSSELIVLPAHFGSITELGEGGVVAARLGDLFEHNPGLNMEDEATFRRAVTEDLPQHPNAYQDIRMTNMGRISPTDDEMRDMEIGPNRCAIHDK
ncbi:MBL fold metallo-hydrolase [Paenibacillus sp. J5C_2022]|uniref:MBL fold metallo-hydrolase n=1 Tax=Paenibacillus sp. J5C2022 TaxID=2977129 RepID=UPI0021CF0644|nr:MBL fold metallo-hydrolase [Paenibacillus sp. J5C2022]MCU6708589.1 MBL fold metallo-hydrolase [Paenibacillus sp. J5C2022]